MDTLLATIERLKLKVPDLAGRVEGAESLARMSESGFAQVTQSAFVVPLGIVGGEEQSSAGAYTQMLDELVGVILVFRNTDPVGRRAFENCGAVIRAVMEAVAGWGPDEAAGVFRVSRAQQLPSPPASLFYQIDFALRDQMRVIA